MIRIFLSLFGLLLAWAGYIVIGNRFAWRLEFETADVHPAHSGTPRKAGEELAVLTWNLGYAGMGRGADFVADGGKQMRPESQTLVERNLQAICEFLKGQDADVYLLQEVARSSWNTYQIDNLGPLREALGGYAWTFGTDWLTRGMPSGFRVEVGNAIFSRLAITSAERRALPLESDFALGVFRKNYRAHIVRIPCGSGRGDWVFVNIHLAAFDPEAKTRMAQLATIMGFAAAEYAKGNLVVVGGDWNLVWTPVDPALLADYAPHTVADDLFWVHPLPKEQLPGKGWQWAFDPASPTNRTAHRPYEKGRNFTLILDGYLCSPGIEVLETRTFGALEFENSDHHPVRLRVREAAVR